MPKNDLSPRETEIVELSAEGLTNEAIAHRLELSIGTVNTYWLRIKLKTGGVGRTEVVLRIYQRRFERALEEAGVDWEGLLAILKKRELVEAISENAKTFELRTRLAMLHLAMDSFQSTAWATDEDLRIDLLTNGELPSDCSGVPWEDGKTIYELFNTEDRNHPAVAAHLEALEGHSSEHRLVNEFAGLVLKVVPILEEEDGIVIGCISILTRVPSSEA